MEKYYKTYSDGRKRLWVRFTCSECGEAADTNWRPARFNGVCPECKGSRQPGGEFERFLKNACEVHGQKYSYENVVYTNAHTKVSITCPTHGDFLQKPCNHTALANGCPECARERIQIAKASVIEPATFYILHLPDTDLYKVGVTTKTVQARYAPERVPYVIVFESTGLSARQAYTLEATVKAIMKDYRFMGVSPFHYTGTTEVFTINPLTIGLHT